MLKRFIVLFFIVHVTKAYAQDANYWSSSYGPGGFMVPGSTIARNGDSGVFFYNPALLAYNTKNAAAISGSIYNYQAIKIKNGAGTGFPLNSSSASVIPMVASNTIYLKLKNSSITIAYALLNNPVMRFQASQRRDDKLNVLNDSYSPGNELFIGQYVNSNTIDETTGMLAFGRPISSKLAVGISFGVNIRKQNFQHDFRARTLINDNSTLFQKLVSVSEYYLVNNLNIGLGIKAGLAYDIAPRHHLGLMLTMPMIHISGKGDLLTDYIINNLQLASTEVFLLASSKQTRLKAKWKTPLSAAAGYTFDYGKGQLYFAAEYFGKIKEYDVLIPRDENFLRPDTGNNRSFTSGLLRLKDVHKAIINFSLAASFPIKGRFTGFCSLRTDFNYSGDQLFRNTDGFKTNTAAWDLYHLQLGSNFKKRKFNLRAGLLLSYGRTNTFKQQINLDHPNEANLLEGDLQTTSATRTTAGVILSYIHNL